MRRYLTGFTLIELLVVIAVIAILAAILFPVFAQAKVSAKGTAALSNAKQIGTSMFIYSADYDDRAVLVGRLDDSAPVQYGTRGVFPWAYLLQPYSKSSKIFQDPVVASEAPYEGLPLEMTWFYHTQFGYAFTIHSPWQGSYMQDGAKPLSQTELAKPSETVLLASKKTRNNNTDWLVPFTAIWGANLVNPPYCISLETGTNPNSRCIPQQRWGNNTPTYSGQSFEEGGQTGGVAFRKSGKSCVVWADGHTSWKSPEQLAAGTTWKRDQSFSLTQVNDIDKYLWDAD